MNQGAITERLVRRIDNAWTELKDSYAGLSEAQLTEPGAMGPWSVKDVLGHITTWEVEALTHLPTIVHGSRPPRYADLGGIDAFNARKAEEKGSLSIDQVVDELDETHRRLIELVRGTPPYQLASGSRFRRRLRLDTLGHYRIHAEGIRTWRRRNAP